MAKVCVEFLKSLKKMKNKLACNIRKYSDANYVQTVDWLNDIEIKELFGITYNVTLESHTQWVTANPLTELLALYFADQYVGNISLNYSPRHKSAYLQIYIGSPDFRGKGLGKKFMHQAMDYAFNIKEQHRIWLHVRETNLAAINLYVKLGFKVEGLERESIWDGRLFINQKVMSILAHEFKKDKL